MAEGLVNTFWILTGVATWYAGPFVGQPLYCGGTYTTDAEPWVAVNVEMVGQQVCCGDQVLLYFPGGQTLRARVGDTGPFSRYWIEQHGRDVPIIADVPRHLWPLHPALSSPVAMVNLSALERALTGAQVVDLPKCPIPAPLSVIEMWNASARMRIER
jgi:hypothetical protein